MCLNNISFLIFQIYLTIVLVFPCTSTSNKYIPNMRIKRSDIDLQTCEDKFDIHQDNIIRTQDSQKMGAKYLNEIDLDTRVECLKLCCETENCDVFVFEEKNSGSCYLFHCGPPEDFKCKFTHHMNYSSAVLAMNRHTLELESQTKHEQDLTKLRKPELGAEVIPQEMEQQTIPSTTISSTTAKAKEAHPPNMKTKPPEEERKCSRNQFECRSTGECIAIYNACDGIPQCADGSDEAPELGCPDVLTTSLPLSAHINNPSLFNDNIPPSRIHQLPHTLPQTLSQSDIYRPQIASDVLRNVQQAPPQNPDFIRPSSARNNLNSRVAFNGQQVQQQYGSVPMIMPPSNNWVPHQSNQMPPQMNQYADKNTHIFNHKENGIQVPDGQEIRYNKHKGALQYLHRALGYTSAGQIPYSDSREYAKMQNYYDNYRQPLQQETWPLNQPEENLMNRYPQEAPNKNWQRQENLPIEPQTNSDMVDKVKSETPNMWKPNVQENPKHEQDKMAHELKHSKEKMEHGNEVTIKIEKHKHAHHDQQYMDVVAYKMDVDLQDGVAETPGGAVLSLTLGLIITCIMALLIACRLRVKKRMRKGGKSYAHDADFLVNGMYL